MTSSLARLGELAEFINGLAFKPADWEESGARIIRIQNLTDPSKPFNKTTRMTPDRYLVRPGDLLVSWSASLGVFEWSGPDTAVLNQHIFRVLPKDARVDKRYLRYALEEALVAMQRHLHGATMQHVNRGEFLDTKVPIPSLAEQRRLAALLDDADKLRQKRRQAIGLLETLPQAIFYDAFGDPAAPTSEVPVAPLSSVAELINGDRSGNYPSGDDLVDCGILFLSTKNINGSDIDLSTCNFITERKFHSLSQGKLKKYDLVITLRGTLGECAEFDCLHETGFINAQMMIIRPGARLYPKYLREFIAHPQTQGFLKRSSSGSAVPQLTGKQIGELVIPIPSRAAQELFCQRISRVRTIIADAASHLAEIDALFTSLQCRAFNGELTSKDAERELAIAG